MTSLPPILGLPPLVLGWGESGEAQAHLARAVIGGLPGFHGHHTAVRSRCPSPVGAPGRPRPWI